MEFTFILEFIVVVIFVVLTPEAGILLVILL
jgi:hypothetical protein